MAQNRTGGGGAGAEGGSVVVVRALAHVGELGPGERAPLVFDELVGGGERDVVDHPIAQLLDDDAELVGGEEGVGDERQPCALLQRVVAREGGLLLPSIEASDLQLLARDEHHLHRHVLLVLGAAHVEAHEVVRRRRECVGHLLQHLELVSRELQLPHYRSLLLHVNHAQRLRRRRRGGFGRARALADGRLGLEDVHLRDVVVVGGLHPAAARPARLQRERRRRSGGGTSGGARRRRRGQMLLHSVALRRLERRASGLASRGGFMP
mmetsp:Transcript_54198/g.124798  ORF Transcript_54198/g.124798 Transcript_54198/m.124798 type:complete len:266 (-) Transcript_54198:24-821(-)